MKRILILVSFAVSFSSYSQQSSVTIRTVPNYNSWGWEAIVMQNDLITVATVPVIGARVMQYDLGGHPSIFVDPTQLGRTYTPVRGGQQNFGGFKNWPSPQNAWPGSWPPPPTLDYGAYTSQIVTQTSDSVTVFTASPTEQWIASGIRFERKATAFAGTSRIRMEQTIVNDGTAAANWGMWDITQSIVHHAGENDYDNFWAYFPINPNSTMGSDGVTPENNRLFPACKGEVAPGIYGVQFHPDGTKIFADPDKGWIAYTDLKDSVVYAKTFDVFEGQTYPDDGARVTVYVSGGGSNPYMEIEVKGPVYDLASGGGRETFTENWYATKMHGPVLDVTGAGAVAWKLGRMDGLGGAYTGMYGVFYTGTARLTFLDSAGTVIGEGAETSVSPLSEFRLQDNVTAPAGSKKVEIRVRDLKGNLVGSLESVDFSDIPNGIESKPIATPVQFELKQNYPNPFNPSTTIGYVLPKNSSIVVTIFDMQGSVVWSSQYPSQSAGYHQTTWNGVNNAGKPASGGVYMVRIRGSALDGTERYDRTGKMVLLK